MPARLLAFSGSNRHGSLNAALIGHVARQAEAKGADVTVIDLRALRLPLYDGDDEAANGLPAAAKKLKQAMADADGFLIASPEYNSLVTPLLLNALDWVSRSESKDEPPMRAFRGKVAGLVSASPGALGGLRGLTVLRGLLQNVGVLVVPTMVAISGANPDVLGPDFPAGPHAKKIDGLITEVLKFAGR